MAVEIMLPGNGASIGEGRVEKWLVADGERVIEGQPLCSLAGGMPGRQVGAPATGVLRIIARTGESYRTGAVLGYIDPA